MPVPKEQSPPAKRRRLSSDVAVSNHNSPSTNSSEFTWKDQRRHHHRPPEFWDALSKAYLTGGTLREFDRRTLGVSKQERQWCDTFNPATAAAHLLSESEFQQLKQFSRRGGPDLSHLRGFTCLRLPMARQLRPRNQKKSNLASEDLSKQGCSHSDSSKTSRYNQAYEQKLKDAGVYPNDRASRAANMQEIRQHVAKPRSSLTSSQFSDGEFQEFRKFCENARNETDVMVDIVPIMAGRREREFQPGRNIFLNGLERLDENLKDVQPDVYHGEPPGSIDGRVRDKLEKHIIPVIGGHCPAAPNFFLEGKGPEGSITEARRQACHYGALGARAMHGLQNYGNDHPVHDGNAYTLTNTFHAGGYLDIYATHSTPPTVPGGRPQYHMNPVGSYAMRNSAKSFREGAAAYRNGRDFAREYRREFIDKANQTARQND